jgi:hypothetical protein
VDLHESKRKLDMMIMVGMSATDSILEAMRRFSYSFKNADLNKADGILKTYKEYEGKHFTNESKFIRYNRMKRSQDLTHISVSNSELRIFERLCRDYGVDMCYLKRPDNLEELFERSQRGEQLSKTQQDILNAFTVTDLNGNKILKDDASLIIFNTLDLDIMDRILDRLEEKTMNIARRKQRAQDFLNRMKKDHKEHDHQKDKSKENMKDFQKDI